MWVRNLYNSIASRLDFILDTLEINEKGLASLLELLIQAKGEFELKELEKKLNFSEKKTYRLLNKLYKLGLISKRGFPMRISIVSNYKNILISLISDFVETSKKKLFKMQKELYEIVEEIYIRSNAKNVQKDFVIMDSVQDWTLYIPEESGIIKVCTGKFHTNPAVVRGQNLIDFFSDEIINLSLSKMLNKKIQFLYNKEVLMRNIDYFRDKLNKYKRIIGFSKELREKLTDFEIRVFDKKVASDFVIINNLLIFFPIYDPLKPYIIGNKSIRDRDIIKIYIKKFDELWGSSRGVEDVIEEVELDRNTLDDLRHLLLF